MTEKLEYVVTNDPNDTRLYRVRRYLENGGVELLVVAGPDLYTTLVIQIEHLEPVKRDPYEVLGSISPAD